MGEMTPREIIAEVIAASDDDLSDDLAEWVLDALKQHGYVVVRRRDVGAAGDR